MLGITVNNDVEQFHTDNNGGTNPFNGRAVETIADWDGAKNLLRIYSTSQRTWNDKLYLKPLPTDQIQLNPNLTQNPGWN